MFSIAKEMIQAGWNSDSCWPNNSSKPTPLRKQGSESSFQHLVRNRYHHPRTHCLIGYKFRTQVSRALNTVTFLTAGVSAAFPGKGIDNVTGGGAPVWTGGFVNVVINF